MTKIILKSSRKKGKPRRTVAEINNGNAFCRKCIHGEPLMDDWAIFDGKPVLYFCPWYQGGRFPNWHDSHCGKFQKKDKDNEKDNKRK